VSQEGSSHNHKRRATAAQASLALTRNTLWNVLGSILPLVLTGVTIPIVIHVAGAERYGVFSIAIALLGYFGFLDLGMGRSAIKFLAEAFEHKSSAEVRATFWTSLSLVGLTGVIAALFFAALTPLLVHKVLNIPAELRSEALAALYMMAFAVPLVSVHAVSRGTLDAQHKFSLSNVIFVVNSTITQTAPLVALLFGHSLEWLVGALVLSRLWGTSVFLVVALRHLDNPFGGPFFLRKRVRTLISYSSWQGLTNVISPILENADRFVLGALSSLTTVAYYAVPSTVVQRLSLLSMSLGRTTFPIFSAEYDVQRRSHVYVRSGKYLVLVMAPLSASIIAFAPDFMHMWLGSSFAQNSAPVLQILAIGLLMNSLAILPFSLIQGLGRADITAKFHLLEVPLFLLLLWYGVQHIGIMGAALAWTARVGADFLLLVLYVRFANMVDVQVVTRGRLQLTFCMGCLLLVAGWLIQVLTNQPLLKLGLWGLLLGTAAYLAWRSLLTLEERQTGASYIRRATTLVGRHAAGSNKD
jgi:O-antigen/teichoic acid export membrane protein